MIGVLASGLFSDKRIPQSMLVGAELAGRDFVRNLARYLPPGQAGLIAGEQQAAMLVAELCRLAESVGDSCGQGQVIGIHTLPALIGEGAISALHNPSVPQLQQLTYLRSQYAARPFPVTALAHGFSLSALLWDFFARLLVTPALACDSIICSTQAARQAFANQLEQARQGLQSRGVIIPASSLRLDVIPLGVDSALYRVRDRADARYLLGLPQNKTLLLYFGRLDAASKADLHPLLLAFRLLMSRHGLDITLVLAGAGNEQAVSDLYRAADIAVCAEQVVVRPCPTPIEAPLYYAAADIFVSLSDTVQESFGLTLLEAMASGLPVVVSDWSGYREIVEHETSGFRITTYWMECDSDISEFAPLQSWVPQHFRQGQSVVVDVEELIGYLDTLISSPQLRNRMGQAARRRVEEAFAWPVIIAQYAELWRELQQIAVGLDPLPPPAFDALEQPAYYRSYAHFATIQLTGSEQLTITSLGLHACQNPPFLLLHTGMRQAINIDVLLKMLNDVQQDQRQLTVEEAIQRLSKKFQLTPPNATQHLLWLCKYGMLNISEKYDG